MSPTHWEIFSLPLGPSSYDGLTTFLMCNQKSSGTPEMFRIEIYVRFADATCKEPSSALPVRISHPILSHSLFPLSQITVSTLVFSWFSMHSALPPQALLKLFLWPRLFLFCLIIWLASSQPSGLSLHITFLRESWIPCPTLQKTDSSIILSSSPLLFLHST